MPNPTIRDVAQRAGVGIGTVSRVLNNSPLVNANTRQRVLETIAGSLLDALAGVVAGGIVLVVVQAAQRVWRPATV